MDKLCWGVVSAGKISHDFVNALNDTSGPAFLRNKVLAVAARELDRAKSFAEKHGIERFYGSYRELAADEDIKVVYVGSATSQHYDVCKLMLESGRHVLCEKTMTISAAQSQELFELAKSKNLFLMEAVWSNFFPTYREVQRHINEVTLGEIKHVECSFGLDLHDVPNVTEKELGGGSAFALGIYLVNLVRIAFGREEPNEIITRGDLYPSGVDAGWDAILVFKGDRRAVLKCSSRYGFSNTARISGTKGCIELQSLFACPTQIDLPDKSVYKIELPNQAAYPYNFYNSAGLAFEAAAVSEAIRAGQRECTEYTTEDSLYNARLLDQILLQLGANVH